MNFALIRDAADHLDILGVTLSSNSTELPDDFNPRVDVGEISINLTWGPKKIALLEIRTEDGKATRVWQVFFGTRTRVLKGQITSDSDPQTVIATLSADFLMQYVIKDPWPENNEALQEFSVHNTPIHIWPYWREWLQSNAMRIGLPPLVLSMHLLPPSKDLPAPQPQIDDGQRTSSAPHDSDNSEQASRSDE